MGNEISAMDFTSRPSIELIQSSHYEITSYILELESKLEKFRLLENNCGDLDAKYLDMQEDLFGMQIQNHDYKTQTKELTKENDKLRQQNDQLRKENERLSEEMEKQCKIKETFQVNTDTRTSNGRQLSSEDPTQIANLCYDQNATNANSVLVKGFPKNLMDDNSKRSVIMLAQHMKLQMTEVDIRKVNIKERKFYERQNMQPDKLILIVEFSNQELKVDFLKHKEKLKTHDSTKDVEITDFVSEDVYNLYQYAKILKSHGYNSVYWRNNCVFVKKTRSTNSQPILIESQSQVDVLKSLK